MPHNRYFLSTLDEPLILEGQEFQHLTKVMRAKVTDSIELVDGKGSLAVAKIEKLEKRKAHLTLVEIHKVQKPSNTLILAQAIPRQNRIETIVEKGTELGMTELWLFPSSGSEKKKVTESRLQSIAISAMKQCGRLYLPEIRYFSSLQECPFQDIDAYFGDFEGSKLGEVSSNNLIFIGPEKGFTDEEISWFRSNEIKGVKLHDNILRTDTAAIVSLAKFSFLSS